MTELRITTKELAKISFNKDNPIQSTQAFLESIDSMPIKE